MIIDPKLRKSLRRIGRDNAHSPARLKAAVDEIRFAGAILAAEENLYDEQAIVEIELLVAVILDAALEAQEQKRGASVQ